MHNAPQAEHYSPSRKLHAWICLVLASYASTWTPHQPLLSSRLYPLKYTCTLLSIYLTNSLHTYSHFVSCSLSGPEYPASFVDTPLSNMPSAQAPKPRDSPGSKLEHAGDLTGGLSLVIVLEIQGHPQLQLHSTRLSLHWTG